MDARRYEIGSDEVGGSESIASNVNALALRGSCVRPEEILWVLLGVVIGLVVGFAILARTGILRLRRFRKARWHR